MFCPEFINIFMDVNRCYRWPLLFFLFLFLWAHTNTFNSHTHTNTFKQNWMKKLFQLNEIPTTIRKIYFTLKHRWWPNNLFDYQNYKRMQQKMYIYKKEKPEYEITFLVMIKRANSRNNINDRRYLSYRKMFFPFCCFWLANRI